MFVHRIRRALALGSAATALAASLIAGGTMVGGASSDMQACLAKGSVYVSPNPDGKTYDWTVSGDGSCTDVVTQARSAVHFGGDGTSVGLGVCSAGTVENLDLTLILTLTDANGTRHNVSETWSAPVTTFTDATPFAVSDDATGVGTMVTHLFAKCPPMGSPVVDFAWTQSPR
jgi:hypothetical protein